MIKDWHKEWGRVICSTLLICLLVCWAMLSGCSGSTGSGTDPESTEGNSSEQEIVIGTLATEDILPLWVAEQEDLFAEEGLTHVSIQTFQSAQELSTAVASGAVHMAMTDIMVTATLVASGTAVQVQWVTLGTEASQGRFGIMTSPESGITSLKDLAGVPIGVGSCTVPEYVMDNLLEEAGVAPADIVGEEIKKVPVRYEMMSSNQVAAAALPGSLLALGEQQGMICLADDTTGENLSQSVMIASEDWAEASVLERMAEVWNSAVERINANPEDYRALLTQKAQLPEAISGSYPISEYPTTQLPSADMVNSVLDWMTKKGYLESILTYDETTGRFTDVHA